MIFILIVSYCLAKELVFEKNGRPFKTYSLDQLKELLSPEEIENYERKERRFVKYKVFTLSTLLQKIYGTDWAKYEEITLETETKYRPYFDTEWIQRIEGYIAFAIVGNDKFNQVDKVYSKVVELGPYYLFWSKDRKNEMYFRFSTWSVYQIKKINLNFIRELAPLKSSDKMLINGREHFRMLCLRCHRVQGVGSPLSSELISNNVFKKKKEKEVLEYILNPSKFTRFSGMPGIEEKIKDREAIAQSIVNYMKHCLHNKCSQKDLLDSFAKDLPKNN